ncbi:MAG: hypothetical protein GC206_08525 [Alphaproteobacteria bacterium]|nr:hypothetical protein [Alphaproteobacteria bacterium]
MTSVTVVVPMTIRRRAGRKQIIGPDGAPVPTGRDAAGVAETRGDPALVKALARGFRWRRMLEEGRYGSIRELAAVEGVDRAYVGRVLNLTLLAPDLVEAVLDGTQAERTILPMLVDRLPMNWNWQRAALTGRASSTGANTIAS